MKKISQEDDLILWEKLIQQHNEDIGDLSLGKVLGIIILGILLALFFIFNKIFGIIAILIFLWLFLKKEYYRTKFSKEIKNELENRGYF